jgi:hypothetical protein
MPVRRRHKWSETFGTSSFRGVASALLSQRDVKRIESVMLAASASQTRCPAPNRSRTRRTKVPTKRSYDCRLIAYILH